MEFFQFSHLQDTVISLLGKMRRYLVPGLGRTAWRIFQSTVTVLGTTAVIRYPATTSTQLSAPVRKLGHLRTSVRENRPHLHCIPVEMRDIRSQPHFQSPFYLVLEGGKGLRGRRDWWWRPALHVLSAE